MDHDHKWVPVRRGFPQQMCRCGALKVLDLKVGSNTISLSPGGSDVVRWSATQAPTAAGDIGMDVTTGEPQAFVSGAARAVLTTFSNQQSLFSFTHVSGSASTGALGFTPRFAIYSGAANLGGIGASFSVGLITGTGGSSRAANFTGSGTGQNSAGDEDAAGGVGTPPGSGFTTNATFTSRELDVTAFGSGGIDLAWSAAVTSHFGKLLVVG